MPSRLGLKSILRSKPVSGLLSLLIAAYVALVARTTRWTFIGREHADALNIDGQGVIVAFWHSRLLMGVVIRGETNKRVFMLSSKHPDAEIIVNAAKRFGVEFIRGSAANPEKAGVDKKGGPALVQMIGALREGHAVGVNPDGPRGPREIAHVGVIRLAQFSGAPILPGAYSVRRGRILGTWDRFLLPCPFTAGVFVGAPPIAVPKDADPALVEAKRLELERVLCEVTAAADAAAGLKGVPSPERARLG